MSETTYQLPQSVVEDVRGFRREVAKYLAGETNAVAFRAYRVPMGVYEQRENDTYMVRVRGAGGVFLSRQVERIAALAAEFGSGVVHATTRQDLQIHNVAIENTPAIFERLLEVGLSSRGGGGNTVRNITASPLAGVNPAEPFDVTPYALALTEYLTANRANFNLPRKFKVAFSGDAADSALASVADLGFFAHVRDGVNGFAVYAGGGMGSQPALAVKVADFIPGDAIFAVAEAMKRLFDQEGDRSNRSRARLRFVVSRLGAEEFRRRYQEILAQVQREKITFPAIAAAAPAATVVAGSTVEEAPDDPRYVKWRQHNVLAQKQAGFYTASLPLPLGDIPAAALGTVADLAAEYSDGTIRTSQEQGLLLRGIPAAQLPAVYARLRAADGALTAISPVRVIACAGASTCKLGLCLSRGLAAAIEAAVRDTDFTFESPIRISGCPNCCGQHPIAPIGLYGGAVRVAGRLMPVYTLVAGGCTQEGDAALAHPVGRVPAHRVPGLLREFFQSATEERLTGESVDALMERWGNDYLQALAAKQSDLPTYAEAPELYRDFGSDTDFSLEGRGPGECGAGVHDVIALDIEEAKRALAQGALYDAVVAAARALLVTRGLEPKKDREIFADFAKHLIEPGWVAPETQLLLDAALDLRLGEREGLAEFRKAIEALLARIQLLFRSLDSNLQFRVERIAAPAPPATPKATELDLRGVACPMNFVRVSLQLEQLPAGALLEVLLDGGEPVRNVPASVQEQGHAVLAVTAEQHYYRVKIRKAATQAA